MLAELQACNASARRHTHHATCAKLGSGVTSAAVPLCMCGVPRCSFMPWSAHAMWSRSCTGGASKPYPPLSPTTNIPPTGDAGRGCRAKDHARLRRAPRHAVVTRPHGQTRHRVKHDRTRAGLGSTNSVRLLPRAARRRCALRAPCKLHAGPYLISEIAEIAPRLRGFWGHVGEITAGRHLRMVHPLHGIDARHDPPAPPSRSTPTAREQGGGHRRWGHRRPLPC